MKPATTKQFPDFSASRFEMEIINEIAERAVAMAEKHGIDYEKRTALMDITACHCNGTPLDLNALLKINDYEFAHDVFGIRRHINRTTGEIEGCFVPRTAMRIPAEEPRVPQLDGGAR